MEQFQNYRGDSVFNAPLTVYILKQGIATFAVIPFLWKETSNYRTFLQ